MRPISSRHELKELKQSNTKLQLVNTAINNQERLIEKIQALETEQSNTTRDNYQLRDQLRHSEKDNEILKSQNERLVNCICIALEKS